MAVRIEIHIDEEEVKFLDKIAKEQKRTRKNFCEVEILNILKAYKQIPKTK